MKSMVIVILLLIMLAVIVTAEELGCPADRAAVAGFEDFGEFHQVMAPTWHVDWPDSNFAGLFAAGPEFSRLFKPIAMLKPPFKSDSRRDAFLEHRRVFAQVVKEYAEACANEDSAVVYELMPTLHDAFEATAGDLLPIPYPEFDGLVITFNLIAETHLPKENMAGLIGSTETLVTKARYLTRETIPPELNDFADDLTARQDRLKAKAAELFSLIQKPDLKKYKEVIGQMQLEIVGIIDKYL